MCLNISIYNGQEIVALRFEYFKPMLNNWVMISVSLYFQSYVEQGLLIMTYGGGTLQDFLHVDNLVQGHILAGQALAKNKHCIAVSMCWQI